MSLTGSPHTGALHGRGGGGMSHVDFKKWSCRPVEFKISSCRPVDFGKVPCPLSLSF